MKQRSKNRNRRREQESKKGRKEKTTRKTKQNKTKQRQQQKPSKQKKETTKISAYFVINRVVGFSFLSSSPLKNNQGRNDDKKQADAHRGPHKFRQII